MKQRIRFGLLAVAMQCVLFMGCSDYSASKTNINLDVESETTTSVQLDSTDEKEYVELEILYNVLSDGTAEVVGYNGEGNHATIESEYEGHKVVKIADSAFENCETLESVLFWADINYIGKSAFKGCIFLTEISIPSATTLIDDHAFEGCVNLESLIIWGDSDIGNYAFAGCQSIESVNISNDTKYVGEHAFDGCTNLTTVLVWGDETIFGKDAFANCPKLTERPQEESASKIDNTQSTNSVENTNDIGIEGTAEEKDVDIETNLTADNCKDLADLLKVKDPCDAIVVDFANKYNGQTIEFDGCIVAMQNHDSYNTRFDILINSGDFDPNSSVGPNFRFTDVGAYDMNLDILDVTDVLGVGTNIHVIAKVKKYDSNTTFFELDVESVEVR